MTFQESITTDKIQSILDKINSIELINFPSTRDRLMQIVKKLQSSINLTYPYAFDKYINNKSVIGRYYDRPLIKRSDKWEPYYAYVEGIRFENGYVWASHGGGCSGEDCNQTFIISPDNKFIAGFDW